MKLNVFKGIQLSCWIASFLLLILALVNETIFKENRGTFLGLLGLFSAASVTVNEVYDSWAEKFSAANVLAVGYVNNSIKPIIEGLWEQFPSVNQKKIIGIFIPKTIHDVTDMITEQMLRDAKFSSQKVMVAVKTRNRDKMEIRLISNAETKKEYYFDIPNTLSSLDALIEYKLKNKSGLKKEKEKRRLEKKYLGMFRKEVEKLLKDFSNVTIIESMDEIEKEKRSSK